MRNSVNRILKVISSVLVAVVVLLAILLVGVRLFGLQVYTVLSGSMEPTYHTGSLIYVKEVDPADLKVRDVITFRLTEQTTATHRIIEVIPDDENSNHIQFRTQGDANEIADGGDPIEGSDVLGTPVFTIPYLGYVASYIQNPPGMYVAIAVSAAILLLIVITDFLTGDKEENEKDKIIQTDEKEEIEK